MDRSNGLSGSTYGKSCMQCYRAKCRCVPSHSGDGCERCFRLRKDCQPSDSVRRRASQRADDSDARIAQLEGKIDSLVSAMQSISSSMSSSGPSSGSAIPDIPTMPSNSNYNSIPSSSHSVGDGLTPGTDRASNAMLQSVLAMGSPPAPDVSAAQAEECLGFFRERILPHFPFISFSLDTTASQLRQDRPVLFHAILTVTTFSTHKRLSLAEYFKHLIFTSALIHVQSNMDLLLGSLTYLAWSTDAFLGRADLVSRLMTITISLVHDMRLFKPTAPDIQLAMMMTQGGRYESDHIPADDTVHSFMERNRALLATFVLSSSISSHLGRQDALRWTTQMEEALRIVESNKSCPTDEIFALHVRLHVLHRQAASIRDQRESDLAQAPIGSATMPLPGLLYLKSLRSRVQETASSMSQQQLQQKEIFAAYSQYIELYINQLAYSIGWGSPLLNLAGHRSENATLLPGFARLECLWHSVENIKSWLDKFYAIEPSQLVGLPSHFWLQMVMCVTILKYLSTLGDPDWDCQAVRNTVSLISAMDNMINRLDLGSKFPTLLSDDNLFKMLAKLLIKCRAWAEAWMKMPPEQLDPCATSRETPSVPDLDQMFWLQSMDLDNDEWLDSILGNHGDTIVQ